MRRLLNVNSSKMMKPITKIPKEITYLKVMKMKVAPT